MKGRKSRARECWGKFLRGVMIFVVAVVVLAGSVGQVQAISSTKLREYALSNSLYYNPEGNCAAGGAAGLLTGDTNEEKVWNYFVRAGIDGVSDNAAVIAGIIGNLKLESGLDPFVVSGNYYGIHMTQVTEFIEVINNAGLGQYWGQGASAPAEAVGQAIELELDWITKNNPRWFGGTSASGSSWAAEAAFLPNLDNVDDKGAPESYADLFLVTVEGANYQGFGLETELTDSKVRALAAQIFAGDNGLWQGAAQRRTYARDTYNRLTGGATAVATGASGEFSTTRTYSSKGNIKYDATDGEIEWLLKFAIWEAGMSGEMFQKILSEILDDYEAKGAGTKGNTAELIEYVRTGEDFVYREEFEDYGTFMGELTLSAEERETAKKIIVDGLRTTAGTPIEVEDNTGAKKVLCSSSVTAAKGAARIAQMAAMMSWPVQLGQGDDAHAGMCQEANGEWVTYNWGSQTCFRNPRPMYKEAWDTIHSTLGWFDIYEDCGFFVSTVLHETGAGTDAMSNQPYFGAAADAAATWTKVATGVSSEDELQPGDVLWDSAHIIIYAGEYGGEYGTYAHASRGERVGAIGQSYGLERWNVYRYTGGEL